MGEQVWSICDECYRKRLCCASCGGPVGPKAFRLEGDSRFYCSRCFEQRPHCDACDRPVGAQYQPRRGGRTLCDRCLSTAVTDPNVAHLLYSRVKTALAWQPGICLREPCDLKLVSRRKLLSLADQWSVVSGQWSVIYEKTDHRPLTTDHYRDRCFGLFMRQGTHRTIFVEHGLPQIVLLEVLAHEFAHAWQSENGVEGISQEAQEGFAEWVAYKLLHGWGCQRRSDRMLSRNDLYGRGLKLVLGWEAEGGAPEVFRRIMRDA